MGFEVSLRSFSDGEDVNKNFKDDLSSDIKEVGSIRIIRKSFGFRNSVRVRETNIGDEGSSNIDIKGVTLAFLPRRQRN